MAMADPDQRRKVLGMLLLAFAKLKPGRTCREFNPHVESELVNKSTAPYIAQ